MIEIEDTFIHVNSLVLDWCKIESVKLGKLTWGSKSSFTTTDPVQRVKIKDEKIILKGLNPKDQIWIIDAIRGQLENILPPHISDETTRWQLSTLVALFIIPPKLITPSIVGRFLKEWRSVHKILDNYNIMQNYHRIYQILKNYPSKLNLILLHEFIFSYTYNKQETVDTLLHQFLFHKLPKIYNYDDLCILSVCLTEQVIQPKQIKKYLPTFSQSKIYQGKRRLSYQIGKYFIPKRRLIGLAKLYLTDITTNQIEELKENPYYEELERLKNEESNLIRYRIPIFKIIDLFIKLQSYKFHQNILITVPDITEIHMSPEMYHPDDGMWHSVNSISTNVISINESAFLTADNYSEHTTLTKEELKMLILILAHRDDNPANLHYEFSKSKTKQLIRSLQHKNTYSEAILWYKPNNLPTGLFLLPLSKPIKIGKNHITNPKNQNTKSNIPDLTLFLNPKSYFENIDDNLLRELKSKSWPYFVIEYAVKLYYEDGLKYQKVAILRITANADDMLFYSAKSNLISFIGIYDDWSGTIRTIPTDNLIKNEWDFDLDKFKLSLI